MQNEVVSFLKMFGPFSLEKAWKSIFFINFAKNIINYVCRKEKRDIQVY